MDEIESAIEEMQKNINDMDRELAAIKKCQASEKKRAYFDGQRIAYARAQTYLIEITQRKERKVYLCIHTPTNRIEAICSSLEKAKKYNEMQVKKWKAIPEEHIIVERFINRDYEKELIND